MSSWNVLEVSILLTYDGHDNFGHHSVKAGMFSTGQWTQRIRGFLSKNGPLWYVSTENPTQSSLDNGKAVGHECYAQGC